MKKKSITKKCSICGVIYHPYPSRIAKYCGQDCYNIAQRTNKPLKCETCGKEFYCSKSQQKLRGRKNCSKECQSKTQSKRWLDSHAEKLKEDRELDLLPRYVSKKYPLSTYIKKLDIVYSIYIRTKDSKNGYNTCVTCKKVFPIKQLDCGHYVSRSHKSLRFDERNTHPQCRYCNRYCEGAKDEYAIYLVKKYGKTILDELNKTKHQIKKWTQQELEDLIVYYKGRIKEMTA